MTARVDLHATLERHAYEHAVICTYTFEPQFFEEYCLAHFSALVGNNLTVLVDHGTYDEILAGRQEAWPRLANLRYLLHPVRVPGTFHPKVFLFASRDRGLLIIGSANFSKSGITSNAEFVGVFRYERERNEADLGLFRQVMRFLSTISQRWPGRDLTSNLEQMLAGAAWLQPTADDPAPRLRFAHNLDEPLWPQLTSGLPPRVDELHVLSRYFDAGPHLLDRIAHTPAAGHTTVWTQNGITTMTPAWFHHPAIASGAVTVKDVAVADDEHPQKLHAKAVVFLNGTGTRLAYGSANFTSAALFTTAAQRNVEVMLVVDDLGAEDCDVGTLFDPCGSARQLLAADLLTAPRDPEKPSQPAYAFLLHEATLDGRTLTCRCDANASGTTAPQPALVAVLEFSDGGRSVVPLAPHGAEPLGLLDEQAEMHCRSGSTVVHIERSVVVGDVLRSNSMLLVNLVDADSGRGQRRERRVREAQRTAAGFHAMLGDLLHPGQEDALKDFLTLCEIPLIEAARGFPIHRGRPAWTPPSGWGDAPDRTLRVYASLHDAALGFCERHLKRMARHVARATVAGVPNFMHMALAIGDVLRAQVERALSGLGGMKRPIDAEDWNAHRLRLGQYVTTFRDCVDLLQDRYVPALRKLFGPVPLKAAFDEDAAPMRTLCDAFLTVRDRVEACRQGSLRVRISTGKLIDPPLFNHDVLSTSTWKRIAPRIHRAREVLVQLEVAA